METYSGLNIDTVLFDENKNVSLLAAI